MASMRSVHEPSTMEYPDKVSVIQGLNAALLDIQTPAF
jgi:hypothetical protein